MNWRDVFAVALIASLGASLLRADAQVPAPEAQKSKLASWKLDDAPLNDQEVASLLQSLKRLPSGQDKLLVALPSEPTTADEELQTALSTRKNDSTRYYQFEDVSLEEIKKGIPSELLSKNLSTTEFVIDQPRGGDPRVQHTIGGIVGTDVLKAFNIQLQQPKGGGHGGKLQGDPRCIVASNDLGRKKSISDALGRLATPEEKFSAMEYVKHCMTPIADIDLEETTPSFIRSSDPRRIMGVFEYAAPSKEPAFCSGFFISSTRVMTARHCFYLQLKASSQSPNHAKLQSGQIIFRRLTPPYEQVLLREEVSERRQAFFQGSAGKTSIQAQEDFLVLETQSPVGNLPAVDFVISTAMRTPTWIAGPAVVESKQSLPSSVGTIGWGSGLECSAFSVDANCMAHICQAVTSFSGAPLIDPSSSRDSVKILGMHLGPYQTMSAECPFPKSMSDTSKQAINRANGAISGSRLRVGLREYYN
ncbi:hypothetical protein [Pseudoxanthomonas sp. PXM01]|uniref:hypothetical protein n=1 Tax=Pseudoxanthomonas sp. PXM01 TaxID=2769295 RepID=UPI001781ACC3|nr:hypothetical protein [Pseudoxanthomonas sp. PXM01]MBD9471237.1 hypothetical protein [Pseudoxanthomonas sp. PXM01]